MFVLFWLYVLFVCLDMDIVFHKNSLLLEICLILFLIFVFARVASMVMWFWRLGKAVSWWFSTSLLQNLHFKVILSLLNVADFLYEEKRILGRKNVSLNGHTQKGPSMICNLKNVQWLQYLQILIRCWKGKKVKLRLQGKQLNTYTYELSDVLNFSVRSIRIELSHGMILFPFHFAFNI